MYSVSQSFSINKEKTFCNNFKLVYKLLNTVILSYHIEINKYLNSLKRNQLICKVSYNFYILSCNTETEISFFLEC